MEEGRLHTTAGHRVIVLRQGGERVAAGQGGKMNESSNFRREHPAFYQRQNPGPHRLFAGNFRPTFHRTSQSKGHQDFCLPSRLGQPLQGTINKTSRTHGSGTRRVRWPQKKGKAAWRPSTQIAQHPAAIADQKCYRNHPRLTFRSPACCLLPRLVMSQTVIRCDCGLKTWAMPRTAGR